jgi:hypothetical protein
VNNVWEFLVAYWVMILVSMKLLDQGSPLLVKIQTKKYPYSFRKQDPCEKRQRIEECLYPKTIQEGDSQLTSSRPVNLWELRELALSRGGLLNAKFRQCAWPRLVGISPLTVQKTEHIPDLTRSYSGDQEDNREGGVTPTHSNLEQEQPSQVDSIMEASVDMIRRDAGRSVVFRYTRGDASSEEGIHNHGKLGPEKATEMLARVLEGTLQQEQQQQSRNATSSLHYYQGLHDIAGVILHNMDYQEGITTQIMRQISHSHLRDGMRENFGNITWLLSVVLPPLVEKIEPQVHYAIQMSQVDLANICLPWVITWFTHDLHDPEKAARLVDAFLSGHPLLPVYFAVALITHPLLKQDLLQIDYDDPSSAFLLIKKMPLALTLDYGSSGQGAYAGDNVPFQEVLDDAITIMNRVPPRSLLDLVDPKLYKRPEVLQRASSISLFKAPASWTLMTGCFSSGAWTVTSTTDPMSSDCVFVRAKLASGVPLLMKSTISKSSLPCITSALMLSPSWGSQRYTKVRRKTIKARLRRLFRTLVGKKQRAKIKNS